MVSFNGGLETHPDLVVLTFGSLSSSVLGLASHIASSFSISFSLPIRSLIALKSLGFPNRFTAKIALVFSVIACSSLLMSIFNALASMFLSGW